MLNESRIRLMTGISMIERRRGKDLAMVRRYFRGDYISRNLLRSFLGYTFCWVMGILMILVCRADELFSMSSLRELTDVLIRYGVWYCAGLLAYLAVTFAVCFVRYRRASRAMKRYLDGLRSLQRRYEIQGRFRESGKEVGRR